VCAVLRVLAISAGVYVRLGVPSLAKLPRANTYLLEMTDV